MIERIQQDPQALVGLILLIAISGIFLALVSIAVFVRCNEGSWKE